jgi:hypothetical protein
MRRDSKEALRVEALAAAADPPVTVTMAGDSARARRYQALSEKASRPVLRNDQGDVVRPVDGRDLARWSEGGDVLWLPGVDDDRRLDHLRQVVELSTMHKDHVALALAARGFPCRHLRTALHRHVENGPRTSREVERRMKADIKANVAKMQEASQVSRANTEDEWSTEIEATGTLLNQVGENLIRPFGGETNPSLVDYDLLSEALGVDRALLSKYLAGAPALLDTIKALVETAPLEQLTGMALVVREKLPGIPEEMAALFGVWGLAFATVFLAHSGDPSPVQTLAANMPEVSAPALDAATDEIESTSEET